MENFDNTLGPKGPYFIRLCKHILGMAYQAIDIARKKGVDLGGTVELNDTHADLLHIVKDYKIPDDLAEVVLPQEPRESAEAYAKRLRTLHFEERRKLINATIKFLVNAGYLAPQKSEFHPNLHDMYRLTDEGLYAAMPGQKGNGHSSLTN